MTESSTIWANMNMESFFSGPSMAISVIMYQKPDHNNISLLLRQKWKTQAAEALVFIHSKGVIHCDIHPNNFLLDEKLDVRLCDFAGSLFGSLESRAMESTWFFLPRDWRDPPNIKKLISILKHCSSLLLASSHWRRPRIARQLISHRACVDVFGASGFTAAFYFFGSTRRKEQQVELIEIMASNGFSNFNSQDDKGWAAIHRAAAFGTAEDVRALSRMGASLEIRTHNLYWTPIFAAVCYNNIETLLEIIKIEPLDKHDVDLRG